MILSIKIENETKELQKCVNEMAQTIKIQCFEKGHLQFNVGRVIAQEELKYQLWYNCYEQKYIMRLVNEEKNSRQMCKSQIENLQNT